MAATLAPRPLYPDPQVGNPLSIPAWTAWWMGLWGQRDRRPAELGGRLRLAGLALPPHPRHRTATVAVAGVGGGAVGADVAGGHGRPGAVSQAAFGVRVALLPLATGAPILRYGLYDLDRIISRTLAYGLLTLVPAAGYAALVLGLGQLLGQDSSLVVAAATLGVAATFQSARRRIQQGVDWRFNRRRYDAARTPGDLRSPAARPGRPGYVDRRAAGRGRPDHAADPGITVAAATSTVQQGPRASRRLDHSVIMGN